MILVASAIASLISRLLTHPIDTVKTRLQVMEERSSFWSVLKDLVQKESFFALYQGIGITLLFSVPGLCVYLGIYELLSDFFVSNGFERQSLVSSSISAAVAELLSGLFWTPMEIIKSRQQMEDRNEMRHLLIDGEEETMGKTTFDHIKFIWKHEGFLGFFSGYWLSIAVFLPYSVVYFICYENIKIFADSVNWSSNSQSLIVCDAAVSAAVAGLVSNVCDVIKTQWQVQIHLQEDHTSWYQLISDNGLSVFLKGADARVLWAIPSAVLNFSIFEALKHYEMY
ncbi:mitochondrial carrier domain-containing protein [Gorgonomyces haynaldii]|nr:mitochondrial carrier domain-containing protein [Gorgonomyces haynaldii]KAI8914238.1 mitochondrial carrier domain-containing protein [Gorgonomyces haynaldii]